MATKQPKVKAAKLKHSLQKRAHAIQPKAGKRVPAVPRKGTASLTQAKPATRRVVGMAAASRRGIAGTTPTTPKAALSLPSAKAPGIVKAPTSSVPETKRPPIAELKTVSTLAETPEEVADEIKDETRVHEEGEG